MPMLTIRLTDAEMAELKAHADERGQSLTTFVRRALAGAYRERQPVDHIAVPRVARAATR